MRVTVRLFARLRELAGREEWVCEVPAGASASDVWRLVTEAHPSVTEYATSLSCAVNADFASMSAEVHDGDDVAFLPPVSGGSTCGPHDEPGGQAPVAPARGGRSGA